jgi:hypothetical protein
MQRKCLLLVVLLTVPALGQAPQCKGNPKVVSECFTVHGRARFGNGTPSLSNMANRYEAHTWSYSRPGGGRCRRSDLPEGNAEMARRRIRRFRRLSIHSRKDGAHADGVRRIGFASCRTRPTDKAITPRLAALTSRGRFVPSVSAYKSPRSAKDA